MGEGESVILRSGNVAKNWQLCRATGSGLTIDCTGREVPSKSSM